MAAKVKGKIVSKVRKSNKKTPVKAGATPRPHGGAPTQAIITLRTKIIDKHRNG
jgi:hypothetical protein